MIRRPPRPTLFPYTTLSRSTDTDDLWRSDGSTWVKVATGGTVTSAEITDATITGADVATDTLTASNIASEAHTTDHHAQATIASAHILTDVITASNIAAGAVALALPVGSHYLFCNDPPTTETHPLPLHDALPIYRHRRPVALGWQHLGQGGRRGHRDLGRDHRRPHHRGRRRHRHPDRLKHRLRSAHHRPPRTSDHRIRTHPHRRHHRLQHRRWRSGTRPSRRFTLSFL